jgi:hypothetical protein
MRLQAYSLLPCSCLLLLVAGCSTSETVQQTNTSQAAGSPVAATSQPTGAAPSPSVSPEQTANAQSQPASETKPAASSNRPDACTLLSKADIKSVQGEAVKDTKLSENNDGGYAISQCYFSVENLSKSVSLQVARADPANKAHLNPRDFWNNTFHKEGAEEKNKEKEREEKRAKAGEKEKEGDAPAGEKSGRGEVEESSPPKKISGVGDEAFWLGNRVGGALYVLKDNAYIRLSIGGADNQDTKIKKSKTLAQMALRRL